MLLKHILTEMTFVVTHRKLTDAWAEAFELGEDVAQLVGTIMYLQAKREWSDAADRGIGAKYGNDFQRWFNEYYLQTMTDPTIQQFGTIVKEKLSAHFVKK